MTSRDDDDQSAAPVEQQPEGESGEKETPKRLSPVRLTPSSWSCAHSVRIKRRSEGFGFTLRHLVVYPSDTLKAASLAGKHPTEIDPTWDVRKRLPLDAIYVREVKPGGAAEACGLAANDRIVAANGRCVQSYAHCVQLIHKCSGMLELSIIPKKDDCLLQYFFTHVPCGSRSNSQQRGSSIPTPLPLSQSPSSTGDWSMGDTPPESPRSCWLPQSLTPRPYSSASANHHHGIYDVPPLVMTASYPSSHTSHYHTSLLSSSIPPSSSNLHPTSSLLYHHQPLQQTLSSSDVRAETTSPLPWLRMGGPFVPPSSSVPTQLSSLPPTLSPRPLHMDQQAVLISNQDHHHDYDVRFGNVTLSGTQLNTMGKDESLQSLKQAPSSLANTVAPSSAAPVFSPLVGGAAYTTMSTSSTRSDLVQSPLGGAIISGCFTPPANLADDFGGNTSTCSSPLPPNLVAQRLKHFESGGVLAKSMERMKLYRHELSRVASPPPPTVMMRTQQFDSPPPTPGAATAALSPITVLDAKLQQRSPLNQRQDSETGDSASGLRSPVAINPGSRSLSGGAQVARRISYLKATERTPPPTAEIESPPPRGGGVPPPPPLVLTGTGATSTLHHHYHHPPVVMTRSMEVPSSRDLDTSMDNASLPGSDTISLTASSGGSHRIQRLKAFFVERSSVSNSPIDSPRAPSLSAGSSTDPISGAYSFDLTATHQPTHHQGWLACKTIAIDKKRSTDRSWRLVMLSVKSNMVYIIRDKKDGSAVLSGNGGAVESSGGYVPLRPPLDVEVARDYTKRKNVFRVRTTSGSEYLFQAETPLSMDRWMDALRSTNENASIEDAEVAELMSGSASGRGTDTEVTSSGGTMTGSVRQQALPISGKKLPFRHRSPTTNGSSPKVKSRRASLGERRFYMSDEPSVKTATIFRGKMAHLGKRLQGSFVTSFPAAPSGSKGQSIGVPLEDCPASADNEYVPWLVEYCCRIVESKGLDTVGLYRIPGNSANVSYLSQMVNQGIANVNLRDQRWSDINVVTSLLKSFLRHLPEPLLTSALYHRFIAADKIPDVRHRLGAIHALIQKLPPHNYETLKFLMMHLKRVASRASFNKMEPRNLAIVLGPTLVRLSDSSMMTMISDMSYQCHITETLINYAEYLFNPEQCQSLASLMDIPPDKAIISDAHSSVLLNNLHKVAGSSNTVDPRDLVSSLMSAANRKLRQRKFSLEGRGVKEKILVFESKTMLPGGGTTSANSARNRNDDDDFNEIDDSRQPCSYPPSPLKSPSHLQDPMSVVLPSVGIVESPSSPTTPLIAMGVGSSQQQNGGALLQQNTASSWFGGSILSQGNTYSQIRAIAQQRVRNFEEETRAYLEKRSGSHGGPRSDGSGGEYWSPQQQQQQPPQQRRTWEQTRRQWAQVKREVQDFFTASADDEADLERRFAFENLQVVTPLSVSTTNTSCDKNANNNSNNNNNASNNNNVNCATVTTTTTMGTTGLLTDKSADCVQDNSVTIADKENIPSSGHSDSCTAGGLCTRRAAVQMRMRGGDVTGAAANQSRRYGRLFDDVTSAAAADIMDSIATTPSSLPPSVNSPQQEVTSAALSSSTGSGSLVTKRVFRSRTSGAGLQRRHTIAATPIASSTKYHPFPQVRRVPSTGSGTSAS